MTDNMTMIERVARAIDPEAWGSSIPVLTTRGGVLAKRRAISAMSAKAAIEAMLEPDDKMVDAGVAFGLNVSLSGDYPWSDYVTDKHKAMIKAALEEKE